MSPREVGFMPWGREEKWKRSERDPGPRVNPSLNFQVFQHEDVTFPAHGVVGKISTSL
jgi:hypothetical protein